MWAISDFLLWRDFGNSTPTLLQPGTPRSSRNHHRFGRSRWWNRAHHQRLCHFAARCPVPPLSFRPTGVHHPFLFILCWRPQRGWGGIVECSRDHHLHEVSMVSVRPSATTSALSMPSVMSEDAGREDTRQAAVIDRGRCSPEVLWRLQRQACWGCRRRMRQIHGRKGVGVGRPHDDAPTATY